MFYLEDTKSVVTLNLPDDAISTVVQLAFACVLFFTYPIGTFPVIQIIEERFIYVLDATHGTRVPKFASPHKQSLASKATRTFIVACTVGLTLGIPDFGVMMEFFGSFSNALATFIIPAMVYLKVYGPELTAKTWWANVFIVFFGVCAMGISTYYSIKSIIALWSN
eukprot:GFYU01004562.1.p1 GENE.GFYU01004562.1~~GFYU01004562.1.p1  ORF type:complete len:166 (-),score=40.37 GFYU01004562.1:212-709(-)